MAEEILINVTPQETRVALVSDAITQELHVERTHARGFVGNVYWGRIVRILPGMQSAFVDIGLERTAFLHVADVLGARPEGEADAPIRPIERLLSDGQSVLVQVLKDPIGSKGARLTTQVSLAGRLLVYLPYEKHIGISQRIEDEVERELLRQRLQYLLPEDEAGGFILRTVAEWASDDDLMQDIVYLRRLWETVRTKLQTAAAPALVYQDLSLAERILRDFVLPETRCIRVDSHDTHQRLLAFAELYTPAVESLLEHYTGERPLFDLYAVEDEIQKALARRVDLKSGGYLIFDQTEAMTTIDVNTGGFVGLRNFDDTIFKTNLEAAQAIARQLRLRNLGGMIVIDFIDMESAEHREAVLAELNKALLPDRTRFTVEGFTALGLVEMTRKRTRESLSHVLCEPCPVCEGRGELKTARTLCYEILRSLLRESRQFSAREYRLIAAPEVIDLLREEESQHLAMLCDFIGKPVSLQAETGYAREQYDIVLM